MLISGPEVSALLQQTLPLLPTFDHILEQHEDIQTIIAVLKDQEAFELLDNNARFKKGEGAIPLPDESNRVRYLGYFLTENMNTSRPIRINLAFGYALAHTPFMLMLRSFSVVGKHKPRLTHGFTLQDEQETNAQGTVVFEFEALSDFLKDPSKVLGFNVFLIRPKVDKRQPIPQRTQEEAPTQPQNSKYINIYKRIDTRV